VFIRRRAVDLGGRKDGLIEQRQHVGLDLITVGQGVGHVE
jgi:hypothetical protein